MIPMPPVHLAAPKAKNTSHLAAWGTILEAVGWPSDVVVLDWETYFDAEYTLRKTSTIEFIEDDRFEELGLACLVALGQRTMDLPQSAFWPDVPACLAQLQERYGRNLECCTVVGLNLRFDGTILARKHGIVPPYAIDILSLSRHLDARNRHDLATLCKRYKLPLKGDTMQFKGLRRGDFTAPQREALAAYANNDADREMTLFRLLLPKLARPSVELPLIRHTLRLFWEPDLAVDFTLAEELRQKMQDRIDIETKAVGLTATQLRSEHFTRVMAEALAPTGEVVPMKMGKKKPIPAFAKDDAAVLDLKTHRTPRVRELIRARLAIKSWPLHVKRVESLVRQAKAAGGLLPNPLSYYGAHTGRWTGGEGINTTNLPARGGGLQCEIKHTLIAPPGKTLIIGDAAQIEARGLAWVARQMDLVEAFVKNQDIYSDFSSDVLAVPCRKPRQDDPPAVGKLLSARRAIGKVGILGMGYGMGARRALEYMDTYPELRPQIDSGEIDLVFCKRFVESYRGKYRMIPKFWQDVENVFRYVTRHGGERNLRDLGFSREGTTTVITLPSGRSLFYPNARISNDNELVYHWGHLWGGTITENVVQAMSRDVLAEAILFVEEEFRVAHHVYDSIVACVPESQADQALQYVCTAITRQPEWAPDWPMGVEAFVSKRYD